MSDRRGFDRIIGQEFAKRILIPAARENEPAHAYLFIGPQGAGKLTTAIEFARALSCENPQDGNACGECAHCRAIEHGHFPDVRVWSPGSAKGTKTSIEQMQEMRESASFQPIRGKWKINIIEQGDTLNDESANCILKLIEEPPAYVVNIILFRNASAVIPTIRSRCRLVRFTAANTDELAARLVEDFDVGEDEARFLATYSQGRPGAAISLIGDASFRERREAVLTLAAAASAGKPWLALKLAEMLRSFEATEEEPQTTAEDDAEKPEEPAATAQEPTDAPADQPRRNGRKPSQRDTVIQSLDVLMVWYRDLLAARLMGKSAAVVNCDRLDDILAQAKRYRSAQDLEKAIEAIVQTKRGILGNANPQIATEALMMRLAF